MWQLNRRIQAGSTLSSAEYAAWYYWDGGASSSSSKRKRKKKRKKKLPRASSHSSSGRARRRQRQWHVRCAGFAGDGTVRAVFPSVVVRPEVLDALAGMDQKGNCALIVSLVARQHGWYGPERQYFRRGLAVAYARLVLLVSLVPLCSLLSCQALMLRIMDSIHQKDCFSVGWFYW